MWTSTSHISLVNATPNTASLICRLLIVKIMLDIFELLRRIIHLWPGSNEFLDCVSKIVSFSQRVQLCLSFFTFTIEGLILLKSHKRFMTKWQLFLQILLMTQFIISQWFWKSIAIIKSRKVLFCDSILRPILLQKIIINSYVLSSTLILCKDLF